MQTVFIGSDLEAMEVSSRVKTIDCFVNKRRGFVKKKRHVPFSRVLQSNSENRPFVLSNYNFVNQMCIVLIPFNNYLGEIFMVKLVKGFSLADIMNENESYFRNIMVIIPSIKNLIISM